MGYVKVRNVTRHTELGQKIRVARSLLDRALGLLTTKSLNSGEGLWISPCKSIHTYFMRFPIDVLFIDAGGVVISQKTYAPWHMSSWVGASKGVLELPAGSVQKTATQVGDCIEFEGLN